MRSSGGGMVDNSEDEMALTKYIASLCPHHGETSILTQLHNASGNFTSTSPCQHQITYTSSNAARIRPDLSLKLSIHPTQPTSPNSPLAPSSGPAPSFLALADTLSHAASSEISD